MSHVAAVELEKPKELAGFRLPPSVHARFQALLDLQDRGQRLSAAERAEAEGSVMLTGFSRTGLWIIFPAGNEPATP